MCCFNTYWLVIVIKHGKVQETLVLAAVPVGDGACAAGSRGGRTPPRMPDHLDVALTGYLVHVSYRLNRSLFCQSQLAKYSFGITGTAYSLLSKHVLVEGY